ASSLAERGEFDADDVAQRYVAWSKKAFDIGRQTSMSLSFVEKGLAPHDAGRKTWDIGGQRGAGNGSLMRVSPIPVFFCGDPDAMALAALDDAAITHFDPSCRLAGAMFAAAIQCALVNEGADGAMMAWAARLHVTNASTTLMKRDDGALYDRIISARQELQNDLDIAAQDDPQLDDGSLKITSSSMGYVRIAFRLAFWELLHVDSFEHALLDVANRGGDADTNAAITGALMGALVGESGIPVGWRQKVESAARADDPYSPMRLFQVLPATP
ncbi:MAG: ADP-ribosylglycohydrolase family protein, partial [Planctomycetota bacterium]